MNDSSKRSVSFECRSIAEAELIGNAVNRYARVVLKPQGIDPRNYAPAGPEGAGFGWDAVQRAARDMGNGTVTHMPRRMAEAVRAALESKGAATPDREARELAIALVFRLNAAIYADGGE
jgi:hypothetical protein